MRTRRIVTLAAVVPVLAVTACGTGAAVESRPALSGSDRIQSEGTMPSTSAGPDQGTATRTVHVPAAEQEPSTPAEPSDGARHGTGPETADSTPIDLGIAHTMSELDKCLFHLNVYPLGPVGDPRSLDSALHTLRARVLKNNPSTAMWMDMVGVGVVESVELVVDRRRANPLPTVDELVGADPDALLALSVLHEEGIPVSTVGRDVPSVEKICEIREVAHQGLSGTDVIGSISTGMDFERGQVRVEASGSVVERVRELVAPFGSDVYVEEGSLIGPAVG